MDWSINIVPASSGGGAAFVPDLHGSHAGDPLQAQQDDLVTWNNTTDDDHQPWQTDSTYTPKAQSNLSALIPAGQSSDSYDCAQPNASGPAPQTWTVYYYCSRHPDNVNERGSITVAAIATSGVNIIQSSSGTTFDPNVRGASPDDLVNWNNTTDDTHQPWPTDSTYKPLQVTQGSPQYLADEIPPGEMSLTYDVAEPANNPTPGAWTVYYYCKNHPNNTSERGTIVVPPPTSS
jgi:plastocyanin